jgi:4-hydroxybenzoate polyprenyltransferase
LVLWALFVFEGLRSDNRSSSMLHDMVSGMADGEPSWMKSINNWTATQLGHHGSVIAIVLVIVFAALAVAVYVPAAVRPVLVIGMLVCLGFWVCAEDIGTIATGQATDPNYGLPLALLLLCFWPVGGSDRTRPARTPASSDTAAPTGLDAQ